MENQEQNGADAFFRLFDEAERLKAENTQLRALLAECRGFLADVCDSPLPEQAAELRAKICRAVPPPSLDEIAGACADL